MSDISGGVLVQLTVGSEDSDAVAEVGWLDGDTEWAYCFKFFPNFNKVVLVFLNLMNCWCVFIQLSNFCHFVILDIQICQVQTICISYHIKSVHGWTWFLMYVTLTVKESWLTYKQILSVFKMHPK